MKTILTLIFSLSFISSLIAQIAIKGDPAKAPSDEIIIYDLEEIIVTDYLVPTVEQWNRWQQHRIPLNLKYPTLRARVELSNPVLWQVRPSDRLRCRSNRTHVYLNGILVTLRQVQEADAKQLMHLAGGTPARCVGERISKTYRATRINKKSRSHERLFSVDLQGLEP